MNEEIRGLIREIKMWEAVFSMIDAESFSGGNDFQNGMVELLKRWRYIIEQSLQKE